MIFENHYTQYTMEVSQLRKSFCQNLYMYYFYLKNYSMKMNTFILNCRPCELDGNNFLQQLLEISMKLKTR